MHPLDTDYIKELSKKEVKKWIGEIEKILR